MEKRKELSLLGTSLRTNMYNSYIGLSQVCLGRLALKGISLLSNPSVFQRFHVFKCPTRLVQRVLYLRRKQE